MPVSKDSKESGLAGQGPIQNRIDLHLARFFEGHPVTDYTWTQGPIRKDLPSFYVKEYAPGPTIELWTYASVGWPAVLARRETVRSMSVWYWPRQVKDKGRAPTVSTLPIREELAIGV